MRKIFRAGVIALTLFTGLSFAAADSAQARSRFSLSIGIPLGYYGGGYYGGGYYGGGTYGRGWYGADWYGPPAYYRPLLRSPLLWTGLLFPPRL
jgi:hypothetical protein